MRWSSKCLNSQMRRPDARVCELRAECHAATFCKALSIVPLAYECGPDLGWPGWVLTHGTCYLTNDALNDPVIVPEIRERFGVISGMSIPIMDGEKDVIAVR